ncbi:MAG: choice-of-anchor tandem repeat GloVer-containing protein, partial [Terriglobales bacterium]
MKKSTFLGIAILAFAVAASSSQTFTNLVNFDDLDGTTPAAGLIQGTDGNLYGMTSYGGTQDAGTVFKTDTQGDLTTLVSFADGNNDATPLGPLLQDTNGSFYGTTFDGAGYGTIFKLDPKGNLTTLYSFCSTNCPQGNGPQSGLIQGSDGHLYGTTLYGGTYDAGTVFKITVAGKLTSLYSFCEGAGCGGAGYGIYTGVIQGVDGAYYGTTAYGGSHGYGTFYKITSKGKLAILYNFCSQPSCADGGEPFEVMQAGDGNFYGTTATGGNRGGTVFKITPGGQLTVLYTFCAQSGCPDGSTSNGGLVQGTDGNFYGTTTQGGASGNGTVFQITPTGALTTLHSFDQTDGAVPVGILLQSTNGTFYGTTSEGGSGGSRCGYIGCGTVFSLSVGLGPFVATRPTSGKIGAKVIILGTDLQGTSAVAFNGTSATFKVVSNTEITAKVPAGAT